MRTTIKQAVVIAKQYLRDLLALGVDPDLEEIELSEDRGHWMVTLSYPRQKSDTFFQMGGREFKSLKVSVETGEVASVRIRVFD